MNEHNVEERDAKIAIALQKNRTTSTEQKLGEVHWKRIKI